MQYWRYVSLYTTISSCSCHLWCALFLLSWQAHSHFSRFSSSVHASEAFLTFPPARGSSSLPYIPMLCYYVISMLIVYPNYLLCLPDVGSAHPTRSIGPDRQKIDAAHVCCEDESFGQGRRGKLAQVIQLHLPPGHVEAARHQNWCSQPWLFPRVPPQEESSKEWERMLGGLQTVTILYADSSVSGTDASKM